MATPDEIIALSSDTPALLADEPIFPAYANHCDATVDGAGNLFVIATVDGPSTSDLDALVKRRNASDGRWSEIARFTQASVGKAGYGSLVVDGSDLVCVLSVRNADNEQVIIVRRVTGIAVPLIDLRAVAAAGEPGARTPLARMSWDIGVRAAWAVLREATAGRRQL